jgi:hypothetical protein
MPSMTWKRLCNDPRRHGGDTDKQGDERAGPEERSPSSNTYWPRCPHISNPRLVPTQMSKAQRPSSFSKARAMMRLVQRMRREHRAYSARNGTASKSAMRRRGVYIAAVIA